MNLFTKTLSAAAAALTLAVAFAPAAEARGGHGMRGHHGGHHGHHGGHHRWRGHHYWGGIGLVGVGYTECYIARKRIYDPSIGGYVIVRRKVCG